MITYDREQMEAMPFVDFIKKIISILDDYQFTASPDHALYVSKEIGQHVIDRYIKTYNANAADYYIDDELANDIRIDVGVLDHFNPNSNFRTKREVLEDFRKNLQTDLDELVYRIEEEQDEPSDTSEL